MVFPRRTAQLGWSILGAMFATWVAGAALHAQTETGAWGDPQRLRVVGVEPSDARRILAALSYDPELAWDSHPRAPLDKYLRSLERRTTWGAQHDGFPDARVSVRMDRDAEQLVVDLQAGKRYRTGAVRVSGCPAELARQLERWVNDKTPPQEAFLRFIEQPDGSTSQHWVTSTGQLADLEASLWSDKQFATFDEPAVERIRKHVARGLAHLGWDDSRMTVEMSRDEAAAVATLEITIANLGSPARIRELTVVGAERNRREDVLGFLKLDVDQLLSANRLAECEYQLRASARFRHSKVESRRRSGGEGVEVTVTLDEYAHAPRLGESFSREEQALLRCREWLMKHHERGEEIVLRRDKPLDNSPGLDELVIAGQRGLLVRFGRPAGRKLSIYVGPHEGGFYLSDQGGALTISPTVREQLRGTMYFMLADPSMEKHSFKTMLGFGMHSSGNEEQRAPFTFDLQIEPVSMLAMAHEGNPKFDWQGNELSVSTDKLRCKLDAPTGRIIEMQHLLEGGSTWRMTCEKNHFERRLVEVRRDAGTNAYDAARPVTSTANFIASEPLTEFLLSMFDPDVDGADRFTTRWRSAAAVIRQLGGAGALHSFDDALRDLYRSQVVDQDKFVLPMPESSDEPSIVRRLFGGWGLRLVDGALVRDSWPSSLSRVAICLYSQEVQHIDFELRRLVASPGFGPLGHLAACYAIPHPPAQKTFASHGLERLTLDGFQADRKSMMANLERLGWDRPIVKLLRHMSPEDARSLGTSLLGDGEALTEVRRQLHDARDDDAALEALPAVLDDLWQRSLRALVETRLRQHAGVETAEKTGRTLK